MRIPKIIVLYRKLNEEDEDRAKEIKKAVINAAQMISKPIDVEITNNLRDFKDLNLKNDELPALIVNNNVVFTKHVPPVEFIKQCLSTPQDAQKYF